MVESSILVRFNQQRLELKRWVLSYLSSVKTLITVLWIAALATVLLWQRDNVGGLLKFRRIPATPIPKLRPLEFSLTDFGGVGDGITLNTEAFEKAVMEISKLGNNGGAQLNVPSGKWLTAPFNLTSHMTLFLAEGAVILGVQVSVFVFMSVSGYLISFLNWMCISVCVYVYLNNNLLTLCYI